MIGTGDQPADEWTAYNIRMSYDIPQDMGTLRTVTFSMPSDLPQARACIQWNLDRLRAESLAADDPPSLGPIAENDGGAKVA